MVFQGINGTCYAAIEPAIGQGGEGSVYRIKKNPGYVLKIFKKDKRTEERRRKLLAMKNSSVSGSVLKQVAWPVDVVYENGLFVGYVMPEVKNNEDLNVIYSSKYNGNLLGKIRVAMNLCAAIDSVHNAGQVCGDLNPKNIGVNPNTGIVTLVDADSYHITDNANRVYRCTVGMPEFLAPEIQKKMTNGQNLASAPLPTFTKQTDLFALAVHIFSLLMNGCHPFACAVNNKVNIGQINVSRPSVAAPQPIENIKNGFFPFYIRKNGITAPVYAPDYNYLPSELRDLFKKAFVDGYSNPINRPGAIEWYDALSSMQSRLKTCSKNRKHMYPDGTKKCPWCELEANLAGKFKTTGNMVRKTPVTMPTGLSRTTANYNNTAVITVNNTRKIAWYKRIWYSVATKINHTVLGQKCNGVFAKKAGFWSLTIAAYMAIEASIFGIWSKPIVNGLFGTGKKSIESLGYSLGAWAGPWGFLLLGIVGLILYNHLWCNDGKNNGYKWKHYCLSILTALAFSFGWAVFIWLLQSLIYLLIIGCVICVFISIINQ